MDYRLQTTLGHSSNIDIIDWSGMDIVFNKLKKKEFFSKTRLIHLQWLINATLNRRSSKHSTTCPACNESAFIFYGWDAEQWTRDGARERTRSWTR